MAKLSSYYKLCPLIDQQNFLGVERDSEPGGILVTLGKNIVIRYKLQDLKQISSWSSKDRLTTQVIYDKITNKYAAVFNGKIVRIWQEQERSLENVKKYKFSCLLYAILSSDNVPPILIQQNGATASLEWAIENRKTWNSPSILQNEEKILSSRLLNTEGKLYLYLLTILEDVHNFIVVPLTNENYEGDINKLKRMELKNSTEKLMGHVILQNKNESYLLTLWTNGFLYSYPLTTLSKETIPGNFVSRISILNSNHPVVMVALNENTIAAYGADANEEGAVVMIYNVHFKLVQATQKLKLFTKDAKLWNIEDKLLLAANRYLAVATYSLKREKIEDRLGVCLMDTDKIKLDDKPEAQIKLLQKKGISNIVIHQQLFPQCLELKNISLITWYLDHFNDLPEEFLIQILSIFLKSSDDELKLLANGSLNENDYQDSFISLKNQLLNKVLKCGYSSASIITHLRDCLNFNEALELLEFLIDTLDENQNLEIEYENSINYKKMCDWIIVLLDANYQKYILSQDSTVSKLLLRLNDVLEKHFQILHEFHNVQPLINRLISGKTIVPALQDVNKFYLIEEVKLY